MHSKALQQSTREAPWRLDVHMDGVERAFVLQVDPHGMEYEYQILKAVESIPVPTPRAYGLDMQGEALGVPCFFSDFIEGESLLGPMLAGEVWAEELYFDAVCALQAVTENDLGKIAQELERTNAQDMIEKDYAYLQTRSLPTADAVYRKLKAEMPALPPSHPNGISFFETAERKDRRINEHGTQTTCFSHRRQFRHWKLSDPCAGRARTSGLRRGA